TIVGLSHGADGTLWLAGEGGVSALQWPTSRTTFATSRYAIGSVQGLTRHAGRLIVGTMRGVFVLEPRDRMKDAIRFRRLDALPAQVWHVRDIDGALYVAGSGGVWRTLLDADGAVREAPVNLLEARFGYNIEPVGDSIYVTTDRGLAVLARGAGAAPRWIPANAGELREIAADRSGTVWIGTATAHALRLPASAASAELFGPDNGLGEGNVLPFRWRGGVVLGTSNGVFAADASRAVLGCSGDFAPEFCGPHAGINRFIEMPGGDAWVRLGALTGRALPAADGRLHFDASPLGAYASALPLIFFADDDGTLWMGGNRYLLRIDANPTFPAPPARLPQVSALHFGGTLEPVSAGTPLPRPGTPVRFDLGWHGDIASMPYQFRTRLAGLDSEWSDWRGEAFREVSPLGGGDYALEMQARDATGRESAVGRLSFVIERAWWARWWAWPLWFAAGAALLALLARAYAARRTAVLAARNASLQAAVDARTAELAQRSEEIERQNARLRELDSAKSRFFAGVSHEFRTPLSLILAPLDSLRRGEAGRIPKSAERELAGIERNARELAQLVDHILDVNRLGAETQPIRRCVVDVAQIVRRAVALFESVAVGQRRTITLRGAEAPLLAAIDAEHVHRALVNLIGNALKYSPAGTAIAIELEAADGFWEVRVRDAGQTLEPDEMAHVFDLYFRGRNAYATRSIGSGIGLAFVRAVAQALGGDARAQRVDGGTQFSVRAPCGEVAANAVPVEPAPTFAPAGSADLAPIVETETEPEEDDRDLPLVLMVDDNPELRAFVAHRLARRYRVLQAVGGEAALALARSELPDAIVSDWRMPQGDGISLCRALRADRMLAGVAVLILAGPHDASDARVAIEAGADDYIAKPFDIDELLARIAGLLRARRLLLEAPPPAPVRGEDPFVRQVRERVLARLEDADFGVAELSDSLHMDRSALFRRLKQASGSAPVEFIRNVRLEAAHERLESGARSVSEVAYSCGFESLSYFSRAYREKYGALPSERRTRARPTG
ncbi:MAG TPA: response regulator, partial [Rudaea sp.]